MLKAIIGFARFTVLASPAFALGAACTGQSAAQKPDESCFEVSLQELFAHPKAYNGRQVCTVGVMFSNGQYVLQEGGQGDQRKSYEYVVILDAQQDGVYSEMTQVPSGTFVAVKGIVGYASVCWEEPAADEVHVCAPYSKPVPMELIAIEMRPGE